MRCCLQCCAGGGGGGVLPYIYLHEMSDGGRMVGGRAIRRRRGEFSTIDGTLSGDV